MLSANRFAPETRRAPDARPSRAEKGRRGTYADASAANRTTGDDRRRSGAHLDGVSGRIEQRTERLAGCVGFADHARRTDETGHDHVLVVGPRLTPDEAVRGGL